MKFLNVLVIASLTLFVSCGGKSGGGSSSKKTDKKDTVIAGGVKHTYEGKCEVSELGEEDGDLFVKTVLDVISFDDEQVDVIRTTQIFAGQNCKGLLLEFRSVGEGSMSQDGENLNVDFTKETWTPVMKEMAQEMIKSEVCGLNWKHNRPTSVIGTDCQEVAGEMVISYVEENNVEHITFCPQGETDAEFCFKFALSNRN